MNTEFERQLRNFEDSNIPVLISNNNKKGSIFGVEHEDTEQSETESGGETAFTILEKMLQGVDGQMDKR